MFQDFKIYKGVHMSNSGLLTIILAAGKGTRMKSDLPKVLHKLGGKPMIQHVLDAAKGAGAERQIVVTGFGAREVEEAVGNQAEFVVQTEQLGTGHAVKETKDKWKSFEGTIMILCGDTPLLTDGLLAEMYLTHRKNQAQATVLTTDMADPSGYGRIIRTDSGHVKKIVEQKDADASELLVKEINAGIYCFEKDTLLSAIDALTPNNAQGEYYLTDVVGILTERGIEVWAVKAENSEEILGINSRVQLAQAQKFLNKRKLLELMESGVTIIDPDSVFVDVDATIGNDTIIYPFTMIEGNTKIGLKCQIGPNTRIQNSVIGNEAVIHFSYAHDCQVADKAGEQKLKETEVCSIMRLMDSHKRLRIFTGNANPELAQEIAEYLDIKLGSAFVGRFNNSEIQVMIDESVRGTEVFIIQPTSQPASDNVMELLIMIDAVKRASAKNITAVVPYYAYARQDRKTRGREPISAKLMANLLTVAGATRVVTVDLHAGQIQGFFDIPLDNLPGVPLLIDYITSKGLTDIVVVSPDLGGVTRARQVADRLHAPIAIIEKRRPKPGVAEVMNLIGDVAGKNVVIVDDMIDTAGSLCEGANALKKIRS
ncbi:ribose-phosphate diphosphokinase family member [Holotrichia oblita]|nr:ribose-phosphate diphosphokinase family member [Holotrichia oblita]